MMVVECRMDVCVVYWVIRPLMKSSTAMSMAHFIHKCLALGVLSVLGRRDGVQMDEGRLCNVSGAPH